MTRSTTRRCTRRPGSGRDRPCPCPTVARTPDEHHAQAAETRGRTKLQPVSRLNQSRRPAAGAPEARPWAAGDAKQPASDTAV